MKWFVRLPKYGRPFSASHPGGFTFARKLDGVIVLGEWANLLLPAEWFREAVSPGIGAGHMPRLPATIRRVKPHGSTVEALGPP